MNKRSIITQVASKTLLGVVITAGLFVFGGNAMAIGQLTEPILVEDVLRGQEIEESLTIFNTSSNVNRIGLSATGDIKEWAYFYPIRNQDEVITEVTLGPNERRGVRVVLKVPEDTPNGEYLGSVDVTTIIDETSTTTMSLLQKIPRDVTITVTDQENIAVSVDIIPDILSVEIGELLPIRIIYNNQGNIAVTPELSVKLYQAENIIYSAILPYPEDEEAVKPLQSHEISMVEAPTSGAVAGKMHVEVEARYNDEVLKNKVFLLGIHEPGTKPNTEQGRFGVISGLGKYLAYALIVILVVAVVVYAAKWQKPTRSITKKSNSKKTNNKNKNGKNSKKKVNGNGAPASLKAGAKKTNGTNKINGTKKK